MKKNWLIAYTFDKSDSNLTGYSYDSSTGNVHVARSVPSQIAGRFWTVWVSGTTAHSSVNLNVVVKQDVTADGGGSFSELVDISAIPAGDYKISANDGANTDTAQTTVSASGVAVRGDLNHDGTITSTDAAIALQIAASGAHDDTTDVSGDVSVTSLDTLRILQAAADAVEL